ncbi:hypothetical protein QUB60_04535 [Microcoleus sp. A2-C5]|uniref:hypothetical protein n=1 Tax=unclassified Microcoleus TaxID=2642155 RepID=UPI002FD4A5BA
MHKLLYFATIGLLAFSIGGCGDGGSNTASPSPSPSTASPSPAASGSPTPGTQTFSSPIVAAQPPGLIRSTNPDERARQAQTGIGDNKNQAKKTPAGQPLSQGPLTPANTGLSDPFAVLPPIAVQNPAGANGISASTDQFPKLPQRQVALLPQLPELSPPQILGGTDSSSLPDLPGTQPRLGRRGSFTLRGGGGGGTGAQIGSLPLIPRLTAPQLGGGSGDTSALSGNGAQIGSPRLVPGLSAPQLGRGSGDASAPSGSGAQIGSPRLIPGLTAPQLGRGSGDASATSGSGVQISSPRLVPGLTARRTTSPRPPQPIAARPLGVPNLPPLPVDKRPPQWRNLNPLPRRITSTPSRPAPPRPPQPIAARPLGVPNLPPLPVDKRPPQWVDPNPPPVKQAPAVPPPPSTDLATGTEVSGVVKVGNETQVIVRVPSEPTSRYVKVGQRLSNGQVLVKRVDLKSGGDPIVILEENGVEVAKSVGEKAPSRDQKPVNAVISRLPNANKVTGR